MVWFSQILELRESHISTQGVKSKLSSWSHISSVTDSKVMTRGHPLDCDEGKIKFSTESRKIKQNRHNWVQWITNCFCQTLFTNARLHCLFRYALPQKFCWMSHKHRSREGRTEIGVRKRAAQHYEAVDHLVKTPFIFRCDWKKRHLLSRTLELNMSMKWKSSIILEGIFQPVILATFKGLSIFLPKSLALQTVLKPVSRNCLIWLHCNDSYLEGLFMIHCAGKEIPPLLGMSH